MTPRLHFRAGHGERAFHARFGVPPPTVGGWPTAGPPGPPFADSGGQAPKGTQQPPCPQPAPTLGTLVGWGAPEWRPSRWHVRGGQGCGFALTLTQRDAPGASCPGGAFIPQTVSSRGSFGSSFGSEPARTRFIFSENNIRPRGRFVFSFFNEHLFIDERFIYKS